MLEDIVEEGVEGKYFSVFDIITNLPADTASRRENSHTFFYNLGLLL